MKIDAKKMKKTILVFLVFSIVKSKKKKKIPFFS